jgi:hypothetical protein
VAATGAFAFSGQNGLGKTLWPINYKGFEPRLGFSWLPRPFMTVRSSYALIHMPLSGNTNSVIPDLVSPALSLGGTKGGVNPNAYVNYITNPVNVPSPLPGVRTGGPLFSYVASAGSSGSTTVGELPNIAQTDTVPYVQLWSFSTQFQLGSSTVLEFDYAGQHGVHLFSPPVDTNVPSLSTLVSNLQAHKDFNTANIPNAYGLGNQSLISSLRPYQQFATNVIESAFDRVSGSNYNAFYLRTQHTAGKSLTVLGSFSWSKSMDDASSGALDQTVTDVFGYSYPQLPYTRAGEYSLSTYDIPVIVNVASVWNLPTNRGDRFGSNHRFLNTIIGGWQTSGRFTAQSGYPVRVLLGGPGYFVSTAAVATGAAPKYGGLGTAIQDANLRPNIVPGQRLIKANWKQDPFGYNGGGYLNYNAFAMPGSIDNPQIGNATRTLGGARNPRNINLDLSLRKSFSLSPERVRLQLRADALNALNHTNYFFGTTTANHNLYSGISSTTVNTPIENTAFGNITSAGPARIVALGAFVTF